ncbi:MAG: hypothetical protein NVSMB18_37050 [Acetobacteraceae bacterium]
MSSSRIALVLSSAASVTLGLAAPAMAQSWVPNKPFIKNSPYVAGDMHNHNTCTDGSVSTGYAMDRVLGTGAPNGVLNFNIDWFTQGNHGGSGNRDCRFSDTSASVPGDTTTYWTDTLGQTIQGVTITQIKGDVPNPPPSHASMYRWQSISEVEYPILMQKSQQYRKVVIEGLETITPGHEHTDVAVLNGEFPPSGTGDANRMAEFEFRFDRADGDTLGPVSNGQQVWPGKSFSNSGTAGHQKAVQSVQWLQTNAPLTSYYVPTHSERAGAFNPAGSNGFNIEHFRDFNNAGPTVAIGIESPGHFADSSHSYSSNAVGGATYGGGGVYTAKIGGLWDGLLGEGRNSFMFISSDWHQRGVFGARDRATTSDFFPGEYSRLYIPNQTALRAQSIVDGMRSGNSYSVTGDMIGSDFTFRASVNGVTKTMGQTLEFNPGDTITVEMRMVVPMKNNSPYSFPNPLLAQVGISQPLNAPEVDHVDLIRSDITGVIAPTDPAYSLPVNQSGVAGAALVYNPNAAIYATLYNPGSTVAGGSQTMTRTQLANGYRLEFTTTITAPSGPFYLRARGTNIPPGTPNVTDSRGNPTIDSLIDNVACADPACPSHLPKMANGMLRVDNDVEAYSNLWFYANPIFFRPAGTPKLLVETNADLAASLAASQSAAR